MKEKGVRADFQIFQTTKLGEQQRCVIDGVIWEGLFIPHLSLPLTRECCEGRASHSLVHPCTLSVWLRPGLQNNEINSQ